MASRSIPRPGASSSPTASTRTSPCTRTTPRPERVERLPAGNDERWEWDCAATPPGVAADPTRLDTASLEWIAAEAPGTAAGALRAAGRWTPGVDDAEILD